MYIYMYTNTHTVSNSYSWLVSKFELLSYKQYVYGENGFCSYSQVLSGEQAFPRQFPVLWLKNFLFINVDLH